MPRLINFYGFKKPLIHYMILGFVLITGHITSAFAQFDSILQKKIMIDIPLTPEVNQKQVSPKSQSAGIYRQILNASQTTISAGDKITVKQFFTGYGYIDLELNKIFFLPSADFLKQSYLKSGLKKDKQNILHWGSEIDTIKYGGAFVKHLNGYNAQLNIEFDTIRLKYLRDSLNLKSSNYVKNIITLDSMGVIDINNHKTLKLTWLTNTYFDEGEKTIKRYPKIGELPLGINFSIERQKENTIMINSEVSLDSSNSSAPLIWELYTKESTPPGKYNLNFAFTYHNGKEWVIDEKKIEITIMNWFERNDKYLKYLALLATLASLSPLIELYKRIRDKKFLKRFINWIRKRFKPKKREKKEK